jgi:TNF receptor-associated protein 1
MSKEQQSFQAEVRQLLDIVIHSLYTDKEIFCRELVSNASDALEKLRIVQLTEKDVYQSDREAQIEITTDEKAKTLTIIDNGIGMTREELVQNLGTIAHSGTKNFLKNIQEKGSQDSGMIGQFGVGFYSVYMVADKVDVYSHSWRSDAESLVWSSDGREGYTIDTVDEPVARGSKMVIHLKEEHAEFAKVDRIRGLLVKHSSFVAFPILLNGERVNTVEALWLKPKNEIKEEEYSTFYKHATKSWDEPRFTMHFTADVPLDIHALLFVPAENPERFSFGNNQKAGVALYCKRVLIDPNPEGLLPEWLRFVKGVIDSADLPLNISRESMQDSALIRKLGQVVTKRLIKFLEKKSSDDKVNYEEFYKGFSRYLKEGLVSSYEYREQLSSLLRFESSMTDASATTSFDDYTSRMKDDQKEIYVLVGATREVMESGPYLEAFKARGLEVAFFTEQVDEFIFEHLIEYKDKKIIRADQAEIDLGDTIQEGESLSADQISSLCSWLTESLGDSVKEVVAGKRLVGSPVVALVPSDMPNANMRAMMQAMGQEIPEVKAVLEINPRHPLVKKIEILRAEKPEISVLIAKQLADQALFAAGLADHPQQIANRMNELLEKLL